jgi:hypothetical protein
MEMSDENNGNKTHKSSICTLYEGDYHLGVSALINSLINGGFSGTIWVGYRGALPPWLNQLQKIDVEGYRYSIQGQVILAFVPIETKIHFTNYKPEFMLDILNKYDPDCDYLWYFDPDIYIRCAWSFYEKWQRYGIAVVQDMLYFVMPECDLLRQQWGEIIELNDRKVTRSLVQHFNGGMAGVPRSAFGFLKTWKHFIEYAALTGYDISRFLPRSRTEPLHATDQDALNIALMCTEDPFASMGPEAMGFIHGGFAMYHAVITKPWRQKFVRSALAGFPPSTANKEFFKYVSFPIQSYSSLVLRKKKLECAVGGFIGRFYARR